MSGPGLGVVIVSVYIAPDATQKARLAQLTESSVTVNAVSLAGGVTATAWAHFPADSLAMNPSS